MKKIVQIGKKIFLLFLIYTAMFLLIFYSKELSSGVKNGIQISLNLVIPSMFLFMIFSNMMIHSTFCRILSLPFCFITKHLFHIGEKETSILLLSLIGGYPVGAKLIGDAVRSGRMSSEYGARMLSYCVNCGPAFLISGVGASIFGSLQIGVFLYLSQILACVVVGICNSFSLKRLSSHSCSAYDAAVHTSASTLMVSSVNDAVRSMGVICGFVVAFSAILPLIALIVSHFGKEVSFLITGLLEVTNGCNQLMEALPANQILLAALFTAFGGICVHLQICAMLHGSKISIKRFFVYRIPYVLISLLTTKLFLLLNPDLVNTISLSHIISGKPYTVSPVSSVFLIFLGLMLLFFTKKSDKINTKKRKEQ